MAENLEDANKEIERLRERVKELEVASRRTSIEELLQLCHDLLQPSLNIEPNPYCSTQGLTKVEGKVYPKSIKKSPTLPQLHHDLFNTAMNLLKPKPDDERRWFAPLLALQQQFEDFKGRTTASERALERWVKATVENHVDKILSALHQLPEAQESLKLDGKIWFVDHERGLNQESTEPDPPRTPPSNQDDLANDSPNPAKRLPYLGSDQICVYSKDQANQELLLVLEYKPPHKVTAKALQRGLMLLQDIKKDVLDNVLQPAHTKPRKKRRITEEDMTPEQFDYYARKLVAEVLTQIFDKMIHGRIQYSYLTTGEAYVWLEVPEDDPTTLLYYLNIPGELPASTEAGFKLSQTAISQVLGMVLLAFQNKKCRSQSWLQDAKSQLDPYQYIDQDQLRQIPESAEKDEDFSPYGEKRRRKISKGSGSGCKDNPNTQNSEDDDDDDHPQKTPTKFKPGLPQAGTRQNPSRKKDAGGASGGQSTAPQNFQHQPYCSQACLEGLIRTLPMDDSCPNYPLHPSIHPDHHTISAPTLVDLLYRQLKDDPDAGCYPLGIRGARGYLFKMVLLSHSYVFVAKGTVRHLVSSLLKEARIYEHLASLQGKAIPLCLGHFESYYRFYIDVGIDQVCHWLLLSYAGTPIEWHEIYGQPPWDLVKRVRDMGVVHGDVEARNVLWNEQEKRMLLVDFSHSRIIPLRPKPDLKRKRMLVESQEDRQSEHEVEETRTMGLQEDYSNKKIKVKVDDREEATLARRQLEQIS